MIIHHHCQVVGGIAIMFNQHLHIHLRPRNFDLATQRIFKTAGAGTRYLHADHLLLASTKPCLHLLC